MADTVKAKISVCKKIIILFTSEKAFWWNHVPTISFLYDRGFFFFFFFFMLSSNLCHSIVAVHKQAAWVTSYLILCSRNPLSNLLCSSGQSSSRQTQRSRVRFPALPDFLCSSKSGPESLSLIRINEELLESKVMAAVWKTEINDRRRSAALTTRHPSVRKSWHYISATSGDRSVGIVRLRTRNLFLVLFQR
jgi:hypothetical protein